MLNSETHSQIKALLLINPNARQGNANLDAALERLQLSGIQLTILEPANADDVPATILKHANDAELLIVGGGDGSLNAAARVLPSTELTLAILPLGTANDLARTLKIPFEPMAAAETILANRRCRIDVGTLNYLDNDKKPSSTKNKSAVFLNVAHIGLAAELPHHVDNAEKRRWGVFEYMFATRRALRSNRSFRAVVRIDDRQYRLRSNHISVGNGRNYGGGMVVSESARIDDQILHFYSWRRRSFWRVILAAIAMRKGWHEQLQEVIALQGQEIDVSTSRPMEIAADGDPMATTPAKFRLEARAINVIVGEQFLPNNSAQSETNGEKA